MRFKYYVKFGILTFYIIHIRKFVMFCKYYLILSLTNLLLFIMEKFIANIQSKNDPKDVKIYLVPKDSVGEFLSKNITPEVVVIFMEAPQEFTLS